MPKVEFEEIKSYLQSLATDAVKYGLNKGKDVEIEAYLAYGYESEISLEAGIPKAKDGSSGGVGIRVAKGKNLGFAASSGLSEEIIHETIDEAYGTMRAINAPDEHFHGFADPSSRKSHDGLIHRPILDLTSADLIERVSQITAETPKDDRLVSITGNSGVAYGGFAVANSRGIDVSSVSMASFIVISIVAQEGEKRKFGFEFDVARDRDLKWEGLAAKAAKHSLELLETTKLGKSEKLPTVWEQRVGSTFFSSSLGAALNGRSVVEGRSRFADRIGEEIAQKDFTLIDDGQIPEGLNTSAVDAEGIPRQTTHLIENGILKHFLFDTYYARRFGTESTGNASRGGQGFTSTPSIGKSTFDIVAGSISVEKAISEISEGILLQDYIMGLGHSDAISGDFSAVSPQSFLIKDGEINGALDPITVAGNFYSALTNIKHICSDSILTPSNIKLPTMVFDGFTISG